MSVEFDRFEELISFAIELWNTGHPRSEIVRRLQDEYELGELDAKQLELMAETLTYDIKKTYARR